MLQWFYIVATITALTFVCIGSVQAQDESAAQKNDVAERKALLETLSATIEKLHELDDEQWQVATKLALQWLMQHQKPNGYWRFQNPETKTLRGGLTWNIEPQRPYRRYVDALGRYALVNDQFARVAQLAADAIQPSPFWIGVQCEPLESYELLIDDNHVVTVTGGMKVNAVTDDSPAKEAGISTDDILVFFNESPVNEIGQLVVAIGENEDKPAEISLIRDQKMVKTKLTPALRKQETIDETVSDDDKNNSEGKDGFFFDLQAAPNALPDDYEATVRYKKGEAVSVTLTKGKGKGSWKVTSENMSGLPEDTRGFANQVFESTASLVEPGGAMADFLAGQRDASPGSWSSEAIPKNNQLFYYQLLQGNSATKLDNIQKQLDELLEAVNQLKGK